MNRLFGGKQKTAPELVKSLRDSLLVLARNEGKDDKKTQKVSTKMFNVMYLYMRIGSINVKFIN